MRLPDSRWSLIPSAEDSCANVCTPSVVSVLLMRRSWFALCGCLLVGTLLPVAGQAQDLSRPFDRRAMTPDDVAAFVDPLVREQLDRRRIAGATVVIVKDGQVVLNRAYGIADVADARAMSVDTLTRIGSATKTITALAVMQLVASGRLDLDRDVSEYLDFRIPAPGERPAVTLRRLLSHRTGFEDRRGGIATLSGGRLPLVPFVGSHMPPRLRQDDDLVGYSNYNAALAAAIIERVSGQRFEDYLAEHIFAPLGMTSTTALQPLPAAMQERVSIGYVRADLPPTVISTATATIHEVGSTGVSTTATDMGRLMLALLAPEAGAISRASVDAMMMPQGTVPRGFVGLGVYSPVGLGGNSFVGHDGDTGSFHSTVALMPREQFGVFASYNSDGLPLAGSATSELLQQLASRYFPAAPSAGSNESGDSGNSGDWTGAYQPVRRVDSNLFTLRALLEQLAVRRVENGRLLLGRAAIPFQGVWLERSDDGVFRGAGLEASLATVGSGTVMQLGAPVLIYVRVPWWASASFAVPALAVGVLIAAVSVLAWPIAAFRRRRRGSASARPPSALTRLALLLHLGAIAASLWLVFWGWPLAALSSPAVVPLALGIYAAAWAAVVLTPMAVWQVVQRVRRGGLGRWARGREICLALVLTGLTAFSLYWRVAGTTLSF
jgi:CubicO group peptidase (beta-lactamase class C family)